MSADWMKQARAEAIRLWGYEGLIDDHEDWFAALEESGETPTEAVKLVGEEYDLTPASSWGYF